MADLGKLLGREYIKLQTIDSRIHEGKILTRKFAKANGISARHNPFGGEYFFMTPDQDIINIRVTGHVRAAFENGRHDVLVQRRIPYTIPYGIDGVISYPAQLAIFSWDINIGNEYVLAFDTVNLNSPVFGNYIEHMRKITRQPPRIIFSEPGPHDLRSRYKLINRGHL